jgi:hypothetical protein
MSHFVERTSDGRQVVVGLLMSSMRCDVAKRTETCATITSPKRISTNAGHYLAMIERMNAALRMNPVTARICE